MIEIANQTDVLIGKGAQSDDGSIASEGLQSTEGYSIDPGDAILFSPSPRTLSRYRDV